MGSPCALHVFARDADTAQSLFAAARADIERMEQRYSRYRPDSLLSAINRTADSGGSVTVDDETASLLDYADACYLQSDGLFDISSGLLRQAWRFDGGRLPEAAELNRLLDRVGWEKVRWERPVLSFPPGMALDFGGIVKEYAADRVAALFCERGAPHALVNLGGDVRVVGPQADGSPWRVGIQHPRQPEALLDSLSLTAGGVATSGDYERCMVIDGVRYGHILNPKTGWPVKHLAAVTVVADFCVVAGSASTIAMLKEEHGPAWLASLGLPHCWVDVGGQVGWVSGERTE
jgi:thiamine biosynthesis lipoprotein